jgi:3-hydroxyisobutyrate dehydrogenase-like beta-hydroxyacid dehydrogenase
VEPADATNWAAKDVAIVFGLADRTGVQLPMPRLAAERAVGAAAERAVDGANG